MSIKLTRLYVTDCTHADEAAGKVNGRNDGDDAHDGTVVYRVLR